MFQPKTHQDGGASSQKRTRQSHDVNRKLSKRTGTSFYLKGDLPQEDANSAFPRISVYIARLGLASRRVAGEWIKEGRVTHHGKPLTDLSFRVSNDTTSLVLQGVGNISPSTPEASETLKPRLWVARKPREVICSRKDEQGRTTLLEVLQKQGFPDHISWVGRLDYMSEGLILLTNDGYLKKYLERPENALKRVYLVRARGHIQEHQLKSIENGSMVRGVKYAKMEVKIKGSEHGVDHSDKTSTWLEMTLTEGKNREIRKILEHLGLQVSRLVRIKYGPFSLPRKMSIGQVKEVPIPVELLQRTNYNYIDTSPEEM